MDIYISQSHLSYSRLVVWVARLFVQSSLSEKPPPKQKARKTSVLLLLLLLLLLRLHRPEQGNLSRQSLSVKLDRTQTTQSVHVLIIQRLPSAVGNANHRFRTTARTEKNRDSPFLSSKPGEISRDIFFTMSSFLPVPNVRNPAPRSACCVL